MGRKIVITEEQYNMALKEGVVVDGDQYKKNANGTYDDAIKAAKEDVQKNGGNPNDTTVSFKMSSNESKLITKKDLVESRLKKLKEGSKVYSVTDFMKKITQ